MHNVFLGAGEVPLPPYMRRTAEPSDVEAYQTIYASDQCVGSVAAPTAGLHFSPEVLSALAANGISQTRVALHVSAGTFRPVTAARIADHVMHSERFEVSATALQEIIAASEAGRPIVAVGTTSCRTLESLYWLGVRALQQEATRLPSSGESGCCDVPGTDPTAATGSATSERNDTLEQFEAYELAAAAASGARGPYPAAAALQALLRNRSPAASVLGATKLCIAPGYTFGLVTHLVTNFHQPDSTLLLLVSAALGSTHALLNAYAHAVRAEYRFLSFGDACFLAVASGKHAT